MYRKSRAVGAAALVVVCAACAKHSGNAPSGLRPEEARWSGMIQPTYQNSGATAASRRTNIDGTVDLVADKDYTSRTKVDITLGTPVTNSTVSWALVPDRCGTGGVPVLPVDAFTPIEVGPSGRGEVSVIIPFELPTSGTYHVDIYEGARATLADVQACAELRIHAK